LSVIVTVPVSIPVIVGVKVTSMVQLAPAATLLPQVSVSVKSPLAMILVTVSEAAPVLERVTLWALLLVPTCWPANVRLAGN
jgi:hypothetical protein